jgi:hypothetical protein
MGEQVRLGSHSFQVDGYTSAPSGGRSLFRQKDVTYGRRNNECKGFAVMTPVRRWRDVHLALSRIGFHCVDMVFNFFLIKPLHDVSESRSKETPHQKAPDWVLLG